MILTCVEHYRAAYQAACEAEQRAIARALADHTSMPPNYWQDRWQAEQKLRMVEEVQLIVATL